MDIMAMDMDTTPTDMVLASAGDVVGVEEEDLVVELVMAAEWDSEEDMDMVPPWDIAHGPACREAGDGCILMEDTAIMDMETPTAIKCHPMVISPMDIRHIPPMETCNMMRREHLKMKKSI